MKTRKTEASASKVAHVFVLEALEPLAPGTKFMFGCTAVYAEDRILCILRDRATNLKDNGVWIAVSDAAHWPSLQRELPSLRPLTIFGGQFNDWGNIPADDPSFEEAALLYCDLCLIRDARVGKIPNLRKPKAPRLAKSAKKASVKARAKTKAPVKKAAKAKKVSSRASSRSPKKKPRKAH